MQALRPYHTAGMTLVASSLVAVAAIAPIAMEHGPSVRNVSDVDVSLTAGGGLSDILSEVMNDPSLLMNIPQNLFNDFANIPYYLFEAPYSVNGLIPQFADEPGGGYPGLPNNPDGSIDFPGDATLADYPEYGERIASNGDFATGDMGGPDDGVFYGAFNFLSAALDYGDSWWKSTPTNVWGWDTANPWNTTALIQFLTPTMNHIDPDTGFVQNTLANQTNLFATIQLPEDGTGYNNFLFADLLKDLGGYFQVPRSEATDPDGYTLPMQTNPVGINSDALGYHGQTFPEIWSGQTVHYDPNAAMNDFMASLLQDPSDNPVHDLPASFAQDVFTSIENSIRGQFLEFLPINPLDLSDPGQDSFLFQGIPELFGLPVLLSGFVWPDFALDLAHFLDFQDKEHFLDPSVFSNLLEPGSAADALNGGGSAAEAVDPTDAVGGTDSLADLGSWLGF